MARITVFPSPPSGASAPLSVKVFNVKDYGAVGDGVTDDTAHITAAIAAMGASGPGALYFPPGVYLDSATRSFNGSNQVRIVGDCRHGTDTLAGGTLGMPVSEWRYTGTGATARMTANGSVGFTLEGIAISYSSASFTGDLIDNKNSFIATIRDCELGGCHGIDTAAEVYNFDGSVILHAENSTFVRAVSLFRGMSATASKFVNCLFSAATSYAVHQFPINCSFHGCTFEPSGSLHIDNNAVALSFVDCGFWDAVTNPAKWIEGAGVPSSLTVIGCRFDIKSTGNVFDFPSGADGLVVMGNFFNAVSGTPNVWGAKPTTAQQGRSVVKGNIYNGAVDNLKIGPPVLGGQVHINWFATPTVTVGTWIVFQGGAYLWAGVQYNSSNASGDAISFEFEAVAGTYTFDLIGQKGTNGGIATIKVDGVSVGTIDLYAASASQVRSSLTGCAITTDGHHTLTVETTSKNASSSGYSLQISGACFTRTA